MLGNSFRSYGEVCGTRCLPVFQRVLLKHGGIAILVAPPRFLTCPEAAS